MKVLYILQSTSIHGGAHVSFMTMLESLLSKGVMPIVVVPDENGIYNIIRERGIPIKAITYYKGVFPDNNTVKQRIAYLPRLILMVIMNYIAIIKLSSYALKKKVDLIHSNSTVISIGCAIAHRIHVPHIWHVREYGDKDFNLKYYPTSKRFHKLLQEKSYSICITRGIQEHHQLRNNHNSVVIYNPIDFNIDITYKKEPFFLFVGAVTYSKGIEDVISAFGMFHKQIPESSFALKIVGSCSEGYRFSLMKLVSSLGIQDKVYFEGVSDDVARYYKKTSAFIMASYSEGFGRVTAEAMLSGALVIGRNTAGTKEQFDLGVQEIGEEIGLRYNSVDELCKIMINIATDDYATYHQMINRGYTVAGRLYSAEHHADSVLRMYDFALMNTI